MYLFNSDYHKRIERLWLKSLINRKIKSVSNVENGFEYLHNQILGDSNPQNGEAILELKYEGKPVLLKSSRSAEIKNILINHNAEDCIYCSLNKGNVQENKGLTMAYKMIQGVKGLFGFAENRFAQLRKMLSPKTPNINSIHNINNLKLSINDNCNHFKTVNSLSGVNGLNNIGVTSVRNMKENLSLGFEKSTNMRAYKRGCSEEFVYSEKLNQLASNISRVDKTDTFNTMERIEKMDTVEKIETKKKLHPSKFSIGNEDELENVYIEPPTDPNNRQQTIEFLKNTAATENQKTKNEHEFPAAAPKTETKTEKRLKTKEAQKGKEKAKDKEEEESKHKAPLKCKATHKSSSKSKGRQEKEEENIYEINEEMKPDIVQMKENLGVAKTKKEISNPLSNPLSNTVSNPLSNPLSNTVSNPLSNTVSNTVTDSEGVSLAHSRKTSMGSSCSRSSVAHTPLAPFPQDNYINFCIARSEFDSKPSSSLSLFNPSVPNPLLFPGMQTQIPHHRVFSVQCKKKLNSENLVIRKIPAKEPMAYYYANAITGAYYIHQVIRVFR